MGKIWSIRGENLFGSPIIRRPASLHCFCFQSLRPPDTVQWLHGRPASRTGLWRRSGAAITSSVGTLQSRGGEWHSPPHGQRLRNHWCGRRHSCRSLPGIRNLGSPEFIYEFMKHMNWYMKESCEFIEYMNSWVCKFIYVCIMVSYKKLSAAAQYNQPLCSIQYNQRFMVSYKKLSAAAQYNQPKHF